MTPATQEAPRRRRRTTCETKPPIVVAEKSMSVEDQWLAQLIRDAVHLELREHLIRAAVRKEIRVWSAAAILVSLLGFAAVILGLR